MCCASYAPTTSTTTGIDADAARSRPRDRVRKSDGKCEGRKSRAEQRPEARLPGQAAAQTGRMGYRAIGAELERAGHVNERGKPFHHKSVRAMLE